VGKRCGGTNATTCFACRPAKEAILEDAAPRTLGTGKRAEAKPSGLPVPEIGDWDQIPLQNSTLSNWEVPDSHPERQTGLKPATMGPAAESKGDDLLVSLTHSNPTIMSQTGV
jgi:hypothetical protein